ncbi:MAG: hypothetical protein K6F63_05985 [Lachnospiraceae bacterium]|nr:hypothetical protein [Lachnospiraceae bacterium]
MKAFINTNLSLRQRITLYRLLYTLNEMNFSYLRPVIAGTVVLCMLYVKLLIPENYFSATTNTQIALFNTFFVFSILCFLIFLHPYARKLYGKFRVYLYRRKKRATRSLFRFN